MLHHILVHDTLYKIKLQVIFARQSSSLISLKSNICQLMPTSVGKEGEMCYGGPKFKNELRPLFREKKIKNHIQAQIKF